MSRFAQNIYCITNTAEIYICFIFFINLPTSEYKSGRQHFTVIYYLMHCGITTSEATNDGSYRLNITDMQYRWMRENRDSWE